MITIFTYNCIYAVLTKLESNKKGSQIMIKNDVKTRPIRAINAKELKAVSGGCPSGVYCVIDCRDLDQ